MIMIENNPDDLFFTLLIQFTYVSLYHGVLPLSSVFIFFSNLTVIFVTERMYSVITKRSLSQQISGLGIWRDVFETVGLLSIIGSAFITTYTTESLDHYTMGKELALLVIIAAEHLVLGLRYLMSKVMRDKPQWVEAQIKHSETMKTEDNDRVRLQASNPGAL